MNDGVPCPECAGLGRIFFQVGDDKRAEFACHQCGGSGAHCDALYRKLSGEADRDREEQKLSYYWGRQFEKRWSECKAARVALP